MAVLTKAQIRLAEETAVKNGTFSFKELMYIAGTKAAEIITEKYIVKNKKIAVICGKGNNGGDGFVIAALLKDLGAYITIITPFGAPATENAKYYFEKLGISPQNDFNGDYDIIIDAIFGIGFSGAIDAELISKINNSNAIKISVDIPSGIECDNGVIGSVAVNADLTVTFIALKPCFLLPSSRDSCGEVVVADIGVPIVEKSYEIIKKPHFDKRPSSSHKGTYGTALLICGSYGMAGAAMLSAKAALRSGLGIAKCVMPKSIYSAFTRFLPEAVCLPLTDTKNGTPRFSDLKKAAIFEGTDAILFGCGIGKNKDNEKILSYLLQNSNKPLVIDADGINTLSLRIELLKQSKAPVILTPHPGEMARLCKSTVKYVEDNRMVVAEDFAKEYNCTVVLKGSNTIVAESNGKVSFNILGNSGMATGGSGDVLAGVLVSLLAQGFSPETASKYAVYLHSLAGDKAAEKRSRHALIPTDIIEEL